MNIKSSVSWVGILALPFCIVLIKLGSVELSYGGTSSSPSPSPSLSPAPNPVHAPCLENSEISTPRLDLQICSKVLDPGDPQGIITSVKSYFSNNIKCYYQGWVMNDSSTQCQEGDWTSPDPLVKAVVCSINDSEGTSDSGVGSQNNVNDSCGIPYDTPGTVWEDNQIRGLRVQGIKYFRNQVINEVINNHSLNISSSCTAMANDYYNLNSTAKNLSSGLTNSAGSLPPQINSGGVDFCSNNSQSLTVSYTDPNNPSGPQITVDLSQIIPKSAACYLSVSRQNRTSLFGTLMECEVWARMDAFYTEFAADETITLNGVIQNCASQAYNQGKSVGQAQLSQSAGQAAGVQAFRSCYKPAIRSFFQGVIQRRIPGNFQTLREKKQPKEKTQLCQVEGLSLIFALGSLRKKGNKKRNEPHRGKVRKVFQFILGNALILAWATYFSWGGGCCGDSGSNPPPTPNLVTTCVGQHDLNTQTNSTAPTYPADTFPTSLESACCVTGASAYSDPNPATNSDMTLCLKCFGASKCKGPQQSQATGAGFAGQADQANTYAGMGNGPSNPVNPTSTPSSTGPLMSSSDATAGNTVSGTGNLPGASPNTSAAGGGGQTQPSGTPGGPPSNASEGGSGGSAASSGMGGAGSGLASKGTSGVLAQFSAMVGGAVNGVYRSVGGAGESESSGVGGSGIEVRGAGNAGSQSFGSSPSSDGEVTMIGQDPVDYFTRISLDTTIFKVVHDRYANKSTAWLRDEMNQPKSK